jgi:hypothetical protein
MNLPKRLLPWILYKDKLDWNYLCEKSYAITEISRGLYDMYNTNRPVYCWINWSALSCNPNAISLLKANPHRIDWSALSGNPGAIDLLKANPHRIDWSALSANPRAIDLLKDNPHRIDWSALSANPGAIDLLKDNPNKIKWNVISRNLNPNIISLIEQKIMQDNDDIEVWFFYLVIQTQLIY